MNKINFLSIIGVGLIGGSIGLSLKEKFPNIKITGFSRRIEKLKIAKKIKSIDEYTNDFKKAVSNADIVIICTPVELIAGFLKETFIYAKEGCIITDVGSIKYEIIKKVKNEFKKYRYKKISYIPTHPIAGSEKTGIENAKKDLFKNSVCAICYEKELVTNIQHLKILKFLWEKMGAEVKFLNAKLHDKILALTSHFLHVISYIIAKMINSKKNYLTFTGGAYKDMTRIAASNPNLWSEIIFMNKANVKNEIKNFILELNKFNNKIDNFKNLKNFINQCYKLKLRWM